MACQYIIMYVDAYTHFLLSKYDYYIESVVKSLSPWAVKISIVD